jgi:hypothetical protein
MTKFLKFNNIHKKNFSIIHNYYSPPILWSDKNYIEYEDNIQEYNPYIQAFLNKRRIHKKEIEPKIKILKDVESTLKYYHNTFYIQKGYPLYNLLPYSYMKHLHEIKVLDSGYIISRFSEEYEKPMIDAALTKILCCGRVEYLEDIDYFTKIRKNVSDLINIFYNGEKLSPFEREIERAYLAVKRNKFFELQSKYASNPKLLRSECFLTFSERNRLSGHLNFRMTHPSYFFQPCPIFERINVDVMFNSLFDIRYNVLKSYQIFEKLKLKFQYRKSLINSPHRTEYLSHYLYLRVFQYLESFEFYNEFNLSLNFKENFNLLTIHFWLIIQRLKTIKILEKQQAKYCDQIIDNIINKIVQYFSNNLINFQLSHNSTKISNIKYFLYKLFDLYTWNFIIMQSKDNSICIRYALNDIVFNNKLNISDKYLSKLAYYIKIHYNYLETKIYKDIETNDFDFSVNRIPYNYENYFGLNDKNSPINYNQFIIYLTSNPKDHNLASEVKKYISVYEDKKYLFFNSFQGKKSPARDYFYQLARNYGTNPYKDINNFIKLNPNGLSSRFSRFIKNEMYYDTSFAIEKVF